VSVHNAIPSRRARRDARARHVQDGAIAAVVSNGQTPQLAVLGDEHSVHDTVLSRRARNDARARDVQDVGAAAVGARVGRIDVAARVAATYALRVSVRVAVLGRRARRDTRPRHV